MSKVHKIRSQQEKLMIHVQLKGRIVVAKGTEVQKIDFSLQNIISSCFLFGFASFIVDDVK
jgi:hypothetical protein